jgi:Phosphodiester glycosidase
MRSSVTSGSDPETGTDAYERPSPGGRRRGGSHRPPRGGKLPGRRLRDRRGVRIALIILVVFLAWFSWSMGRALTKPGGGTVSERVAEWARDHYLGPLVTFGEWISYKAPKVGGKPAFSLAGGGTAAQKAVARQKVHKILPGFGVPAQLTSPAGKPLRGEGQWRILYRVNHVPAIYGTYLRPDAVHTSYAAGIVSMNPHLLRFQLHPGTEDPGAGNWRSAADIPPGARTGLAATFNSGFKIAQSGGGFYLNGTYRGALVTGVASMVYYRSGGLAIGVWGHGAHMHMTHDVVGVRQNLHLVVENGKVPAAVDQNVQSNWGATLGGGYYVWRSGIGVTRDGRIVFVYGPALDVRTLAELLKRAGSVSAMELDINPDWTNYMYYKPGYHPANPTPVAMLPDQVQTPARYYSLANRDFTAVFAR